MVFRSLLPFALCLSGLFVSALFAEDRTDAAEEGIPEGNELEIAETPEAEVDVSIEDSSLFAPERNIRQVISLEDTRFSVADARLTVGNDGRVYFLSFPATKVKGGGGAYMLSMRPDGSDKRGGPPGKGAPRGIAATSKGVLALPMGHFSRNVRFMDQDLTTLGDVKNFLGNNEVGWNSPGQIEIGSDDTIFASDQHRGEIWRLAPEGRPMGRVVEKLPISETMKSDAKNPQIAQFRVDVGRKRILWLTRGGKLVCDDWQGNTIWTLKKVADPAIPRAFDLDKDGNIHVLDSTLQTVKVVTPDGKPLRMFPLQVQGKPGAMAELLELRIRGDEMLVRRADEIELFSRHSLANGTRVGAVDADVRILEAKFPGGVWPSGTEIPFQIIYRAGEDAPKPQWRVWVRPWSGYGWRELAWTDGKLKLPEDLNGLFQLRVNTSVDGESVPEQTQAIVVAAAGTGPTVSLYVPSRRAYWGRGEAIAFEAALRGDAAPKPVKLQLKEGDRVVWEQAAEVRAGSNAKAEIPAEVTKFLQPGEYLLTAAGEGIRLAPQPIYLGPGMTEPNDFHIVSFGDYGYQHKVVSHWDAADNAKRHVARSLRENVNLFVTRFGGGAGSLAKKTLVWPKETEAEFEAMRNQLEAFSSGPLPAMVNIKPNIQQIFAGYSAFHIEQMSILLGMDVMLPLGTGREQRSPEKIGEDIEAVSADLGLYPMFRGWDWPANWWVAPNKIIPNGDQDSAKEFRTKVASALEAGEWNEEFASAASMRYDYFRDPIKLFNGFLEKRDDREWVTAASGPYRQPYVYPPTVFEHVDEVDAHYQSEQVSPPMIWGHVIAYYNLPDKRVWGHPEIPNDDGTGGYSIGALFQQWMWGADGTGYGNGGHVGPPPKEDEPRIGSIARQSLMSRFNRTLALYGGWSTNLEGAGPIALLVSRRMVDTELGFSKIGGKYFGCLLSAWQAAAYAGMPARYVFLEYAKDMDWKQYQAVLMVGQKVPPEEAYLQALAAAQKAGVPVYYDGGCNKAWFPGAKPLDVTFDGFEPFEHMSNNDYPHYQFTPYVLSLADKLKKGLKGVVTPVAKRSDPTVIVNERRAGKGRFFFASNQRMLDIPPDKAWRIGTYIGTRTPQVAEITVDRKGGVLYDVFARKQVESPDGTAHVDFRYFPAGLLAALPEAVGEVRIDGPKDGERGKTLRARVTVHGVSGKPLETPMPVYLSVRNGKGDLIEERFLSVNEKGAEVAIDLPTNLPAGPLEMSALDLIAGKETEHAVALADSNSVTDSRANTGLPAWSRAGVPMQGASDSLGEAILPVNDWFGPRVRAMTLGPGEQTAVLSALNYGDNLFGVDTATGRVLWADRLGNWFGYQPSVFGDGFGAVGFDWSEPEGYFFYRVSRDGKPTGRFAGPGLPRRFSFWSGAGRARDAGSTFAVSPDGRWVASAGNLGLVVWSGDGKMLWNRDLRESRGPRFLLAPKPGELWICDGLDFEVVNPLDGKSIWRKEFGKDGRVTAASVVASGNVVALATTGLGGNVLIFRDGKLAQTFFGLTETLALSPQAERLARTNQDQLFVDDLKTGATWTFSADSILRNPAFSKDGRLFVSSALGSTLVFGPDGTILLQRDDGAVGCASWLENGDLLTADTLGRVQRLGGNYQVVWETRLQRHPQSPGFVLDRKDETPILARWENWTNSEKGPPPSSPSLLVTTLSKVSAWMSAGNGTRPPRLALRDTATKAIADGDTTPPEEPWLPWDMVSMVDSGWRGKLYFEIEFPKTKVRVDAVTFHEDPNRSESWMRDVEFEYFDDSNDSWISAGTFLSNSATHTHRLKAPVVSNKFRLKAPDIADSGAWFMGNSRLGELVFHGEEVD